MNYLYVQTIQYVKKVWLQMLSWRTACITTIIIIIVLGTILVLRLGVVDFLFYQVLKHKEQNLNTPYKTLS